MQAHSTPGPMKLAEWRLPTMVPGGGAHVKAQIFRSAQDRHGGLRVIVLDVLANPGELLLRKWNNTVFSQLMRMPLQLE
jgi:hypothetical protein